MTVVILLGLPELAAPRPRAIAERLDIPAIDGDTSSANMAEIGKQAQAYMWIMASLRSDSVTNAMVKRPPGSPRHREGLPADGPRSVEQAHVLKVHAPGSGHVHRRRDPEIQVDEDEASWTVCSSARRSSTAPTILSFRHAPPPRGLPPAADGACCHVLRTRTALEVVDAAPSTR